MHVPRATGLGWKRPTTTTLNGRLGAISSRVRDGALLGAVPTAAHATQTKLRDTLCMWTCAPRAELVRYP